MKLFLLYLTSIFVLINTSFAGGTVHYMGRSAQLAGKSIDVGKTASNVVLPSSETTSLSIGGKPAKTQVIASVLSLNTPECDKEILILNKIAKKQKNIEFIVVAKDNLAELTQFKEKYRLNNIKIVSNADNKKFNQIYGTEIKNTLLKGLNARAVFIVNKQGILVYKQIVDDISKQPNYNNLIHALRKTS